MRVFITGITGTLGSALANLHVKAGDQVFGCARNEAKAVEWLQTYRCYVTFFLGDCMMLENRHCDMGRTLPTCDVVYHCAAAKHVDLCEKNPEAAFRANVETTAAIARICLQDSVKFVFVSSDKACLPQSVYGATKLLGEKMAIASGGAAARFGNLIGSSGSVFPKWAASAKAGKSIEVTDPLMTRYFISVDEAAKFLANGLPCGQVSIPREMKSVCMGDLAEAFGAEVKVVGMRDGETLHQWIVAPGDRIFFGGDGTAIHMNGLGSVCGTGMSSLTAPRWDVDELLETAGVSGVGAAV